MKVSILFISILLLVSFKFNNEFNIWFPDVVGVVGNCNGQEVEMQIEINSESSEQTKVHSFALDNTSFVIFNENKLISSSDTLLLNESNPLKLKVKFSLLSERPSFFSFKTNQNNYLLNQTKLVYGQYEINTNDIYDGLEQFINITESCQDSIKVYFPYGGTISTATLYNDTTQANKVFKTISYSIMGEGNYITFTKADLGRYFVSFNSCHWGRKFWLTIK